MMIFKKKCCCIWDYLENMQGMGWGSWERRKMIQLKWQIRRPKKVNELRKGWGLRKIVQASESCAQTLHCY